MSTLSARLHILALADLEPSTPHTQTIGHTVDNAPGGRGWRQGTGSGQVDRVYLEANTLSSGASKVYDLTAAGGLTDVLGQAIDMYWITATINEQMAVFYYSKERGLLGIGSEAQGGPNLFSATNCGLFANSACINNF